MILNPVIQQSGGAQQEIVTFQCKRMMGSLYFIYTDENGIAHAVQQFSSSDTFTTTKGSLIVHYMNGMCPGTLTATGASFVINATGSSRFNLAVSQIESDAVFQLS